MLRVINHTHNIAYVEWDTLYVFDKVDFHEYYDIAADPWQQKNLWNSSTAALQGTLHAELVNMFTCTGTRTEVSNCHARSASPLLPPAPTPAPTPPGPPGPGPKPPPPPPPSPPGNGNCSGHAADAVLNNTDIGGDDIVSPCPLVPFPGTYAGAVQCEALCASNTDCNAWTFHLKYGESKWRCCQKSGLGTHGCTPVAGMWSGYKQQLQ